MRQGQKGTKPCLSKRSKSHIFLIHGTRETLHMCRKAPWGSKRRGCHPIIGDAKPAPPIGLWAGIHLEKKLRRYIREGARAGQVWEKKPNIWPKANIDLEELPYMNDLTSSLLCSSSLEGLPTLFLSGYIYIYISALSLS